MIEVVQIASAWELKQQSWQANARHWLTVEKERPISELAEAFATAKREKLVDTAIDAEVDLNLILADGTYFLRARLNVSLPGVQREIAQAIVGDAHEICPYSRATRDNIDVTIKLV